MHNPTGHGLVQAALDLIEESIAGRHTMPSVQGLAHRIGYSVHHFSRLIAALTGHSPSEYIARRAFDLAIRRIRESDATLTVIASDCGFRNYEVFSRAFRRRFGISPLEARRKPGLILPDSPPLVLAAMASHSGLADPDPQIIEEGPLTLGGMWFFIDGSERSFHRPWNIFGRQSPRLAGVREPRHWYQFAAWTESETAEMNILCALELMAEAAADQEPFFSVRTLPAGRYLRFLHVGGLDSLGETYRYIYGNYLATRELRLAAGWEFQRSLTGEAVPLEICIPLETAPA